MGEHGVEHVGGGGLAVGPGHREEPLLLRGGRAGAVDLRGQRADGRADGLDQDPRQLHAVGVHEVRALLIGEHGPRAEPPGGVGELRPVGLRPGKRDVQVPRLDLTGVDADAGHRDAFGPVQADLLAQPPDHLHQPLEGELRDAAGAQALRGGGGCGGVRAVLGHADSAFSWTSVRRARGPGQPSVRLSGQFSPRGPRPARTSAARPDPRWSAARGSARGPFA